MRSGKSIAQIVVEHGDQLEAKYSLDPWQHHARLVKEVRASPLGNSLGVGLPVPGSTAFDAMVTLRNKIAPGLLL
jgi:hypothetical protein